MGQLFNNIKIISSGNTDPTKDAGFTFMTQGNLLINKTSVEGQRVACKKKEGEPDPTVKEMETVVQNTIKKIGFEKLPIFSGKVDELAAISVIKCLEAADVHMSQVKLVVGATNTNGVGYPSLAADTMARVALSDSPMAGRARAWGFDVREACVAGLSALNIAIKIMLAENKYDTALVVASENADQLADDNIYFDKNLFGGASTAILVQLNIDERKRHLGEMFVTLPYDNNNNFIRPNENYKFWQDGGKVHEFVQGTVLKECFDAIIQQGMLNDIDHFIMHQPSKKTVELFYEKLRKLWPGFKGEMYTDLSNGNISSVSVLWQFSNLVNTGKIKRGDKICFLSFGSGLDVGVLFLKY